jgi:tetratricopeptide (TPR) repeat protein
MLNDHPTAEDFEGFLLDPSRPGQGARNAQMVRHLLADCPICCEQLEMRGWPSSRLERMVHLAGDSSSYQEIQSERSAQNGYSYDRAFAKAEESVADFLMATPEPACSPEQLMAEMDAVSLESQERLLDTDERFASPHLVKRLIERSHRARYDDPEKMLHWAQLSRNLSMRCTEATAGGTAKLADLRARGWSQLGNALRVGGRLIEARESMGAAREHLAKGTGDPSLRAFLMEQMASLHVFERSFDVAIKILGDAAEIYRELGESHALARTLVQEAIASLYAGEPESAVALLNRAIPLIDQEEDPHLLLAACHNMFRCYIDLDQPEQALELYFKARELYKEFKDTLILLRASWQEGQLLRDLGHLRAAETALLRARRGFMERGLAYEVAVVSLDLSSVYVKLGSVEELRQTVVETMPIFRSLRVGRDALGALIQLQQIADQEHQALELIRAITARLEHLSNRKALRS